MAKTQALATAPIQTQQPHPDYERFVTTARFRDFVWQIKHDGVRTLFDPAHREFYSRNGKVFPNFHTFQEEALLLHAEVSRRAGRSDFHLDGEVAGVNFPAVSKQLFRESDVDMRGLEYHVFDVTIPGLTFMERNSLLAEALIHPDLTLIRAVPWLFCPEFTSVEELEAFVKTLNANGYEGCVFKRMDGQYLFGKKAANEWVKGVLDETLDLEVVGLEEGEGKLTGCVGKFICALEGAPDGVVKVAPGRATHTELREWWEDRDETPHMIEVLFKERTRDGSLRHPRFKCRRDDK